MRRYRTSWPHSRYVSEIETDTSPSVQNTQIGLNGIWRFPHYSRLLGDDIVDQTQVILDEMGCTQAHLHATSIVMISCLDSDYILGNTDNLTEEFDLCSSPEAAHLYDTSMSISATLHSDDVLENEDIPTEDVVFCSSLVTWSLLFTRIMCLRNKTNWRKSLMSPILFPPLMYRISLPPPPPPPIHLVNVRLLHPSFFLLVSRNTDTLIYVLPLALALSLIINIKTWQSFLYQFFFYFICSEQWNTTE